MGHPLSNIVLRCGPSMVLQHLYSYGLFSEITILSVPEKLCMRL